jgi:hypothetical protein
MVTSKKLQKVLLNFAVAPTELMLKKAKSIQQESPV